MSQTQPQQQLTLNVPAGMDLSKLQNTLELYLQQQQAPQAPAQVQTHGSGIETVIHGIDKKVDGLGVGLADVRALAMQAAAVTSNLPGAFVAQAQKLSDKDGEQLADDCKKMLDRDRYIPSFNRGLTGDAVQLAVGAATAITLFETAKKFGYFV